MGKKSTMKVKTNGKKKFTGIGAVVATAEKLTEAPETKATEPKTYWLNTESGKYHKAGCRTIKYGTTESYWESSTDIDYLKANYEACGVCKPY